MAKQTHADILGAGQLTNGSQLLPSPGKELTNPNAKLPSQLRLGLLDAHPKNSAQIRNSRTIDHGRTHTFSEPRVDQRAQRIVVHLADFEIAGVAQKHLHMPGNVDRTTFALRLEQEPLRAV
jgi:hypothetical protein